MAKGVARERGGAHRQVHDLGQADHAHAGAVPSMGWRLRRREVESWTAARAAHWDQAVKGSSALRAALLRQSTMEIGSALDLGTGQILYDIGKFYDSVGYDVVATTSVNVGYPLVSLALGIVRHRAPRRVATESAVSQVLLPTRSLIAGCRQAIDFSRQTLWDMLEEAHLAHRPRQLRTWVDDTSHRELGREIDVTQQLVQVARTLVEMLSRRGLKVSLRTVVLTTPPRIGRQVVRQLEAHGINLTTAGAGKDLGLDTHGVRRSTRVQQKRLRRAGRRARGIRAVSRVDREARTLVNTGFKPTATWGIEGPGMAPTSLQKLKTLVAGMSSAKYLRGCATVAIRLGLGEASDPALYGRLQLFREWLHLRTELQKDHRDALNLAWGRLVAVLRKSRRPWAQVKGTVSAVIAFLLELRWEPTSPAILMDSDGEVLQLDEVDPDYLVNFVLKGAVSQHIWESAARFHLGRRLEVGVDFTTLHRHLRALKRQELHGHAGLLQMIAAGALWPAARRFGDDDQGGLSHKEQKQGEQPGERVPPQGDQGPAGDRLTAHWPPAGERVPPQGDQGPTGDRLPAHRPPAGERAPPPPGVQVPAGDRIRPGQAGEQQEQYGPLGGAATPEPLA